MSTNSAVQGTDSQARSSREPSIRGAISVRRAAYISGRQRIAGFGTAERLAMVAPGGGFPSAEPLDDWEIASQDQAAAQVVSRTVAAAAEDGSRGM